MQFRLLGHKRAENVSAKSGCGPRIVTVVWCGQMVYLTRVHSKRVLKERTETTKGKKKAGVAETRKAPNGAKGWWYLMHRRHAGIATEEMMDGITSRHRNFDSSVSSTLQSM